MDALANQCFGQISKSISVHDCAMMHQQNHPLGPHARLAAIYSHIKFCFESHDLLFSGHAMGIIWYWQQSIRYLLTSKINNHYANLFVKELKLATRGPWALMSAWSLNR